MTSKRKAELFDSAINWIWEHTEYYGDNEYFSALQNIGYTDEEIQEERETLGIVDPNMTEFWQIPEKTVFYIGTTEYIKHRTNGYNAFNLNTGKPCLINGDQMCKVGVDTTKI